MSSLRKLIEAKNESAKIALERIRHDSKENDVFNQNDDPFEKLKRTVALNSAEKEIIGCIEAYTDILCLKELTELEQENKRLKDFLNITCKMVGNSTRELDGYLSILLLTAYITDEEWNKWIETTKLITELEVLEE